MTAEMRAASEGLGVYTDLNPKLMTGICMVSARRLSDRVTTMQDAHLVARRLQQRGWKLGLVGPYTIVLTSGDWHATLAVSDIPDQYWVPELAPYRGVFVAVATGKCGRR
ncbi:hypothetical protein [Streptomyces sp. NRRL F-4489]|uniref:hypothetical protein n=1 Tax=Streptomyces sp. NRRL F-4489 TaxID=1609095 RepID=UPI00131B8080|nr:hypothetical protein [Streptomyces sp. NRRL F-4489]